MSEKDVVSVNEFKNWLLGVLDFQPDDWVPNAEQWAKILSKINKLDDTVGERAHSEPAAPVVEQPPHVPAARHPRPVGPTQKVQESVTDVMPEQPKVKIPDIPPREKHVTVKQASPPRVMEGDNGGKVIDTGKVHGLGVIDTSEKDYTSSFV